MCPTFREDGVVFDICSSASTAEQIKQNLFNRVKREKPDAFDSNIFSVDAFFLRVETLNYYILEEATPLYPNSSVHLFPLLLSLTSSPFSN